MAHDISGLRASIYKVTAAIRGQSKSVETIKREYEDVHAAPPSRGDVKAYFASIRASHAQAYADTIARHVSQLRAEHLQLVQDPQHMQHAAVLAITPAGSLAANAKTIDSALCLLLGPMLNEAIGRVIDEMPWPANAMPISERATRLAKLGVDLDRLLLEERELVEAARSAGLVVEPGAWDSEKQHAR